MRSLPPGTGRRRRNGRWSGSKIARCGVVWIKSDTCELRPVDTGDDVWEFFSHLRWLYDRQDDMPGWIGSSAEAVRLLAAAQP